MSKQAKRFKREPRIQPEPQAHFLAYGEGESRTKKVAPLEPKTENQKRYLNSIRVNDVTFGLGPAGTGKTFVATAWAAEQIRENRDMRLIVTRPAVEAGEEGLGFLPGDMGEKFDPYFRPVKAILEERLSPGHVEGMIASGKIEVAPLGFLRGWTFKNAIVILDEAQNTTPALMKMFLTRLGEGSKLIVNGDIKQSDIKGPNGLWDAKKRLDGLSGVGQITFTRDDIVRHGLVREIIDRYECEGDGNQDDLFRDSPPSFLRS